MEFALKLCCLLDFIFDSYICINYIDIDEIVIYRLFHEFLLFL